MGLGRKLIKGVKDRILDRFGDKIVSNIADTSSDAPNRHAEPKRDLYDKMKEDGSLGTPKGDR